MRLFLAISIGSTLVALLVAGAGAQTCHGCSNDMDCHLSTDSCWRCLRSASPEALPCIIGPSGHNVTCMCADAQCPTPTTPSSPKTSKPQYLMIGDSISLGMKQLVFANLTALESVHNSGNAANTNLGVHCLSTFLGEPSRQWDIISFQFGLHDLCEDLEQLAPETYRHLLSEITRRLSKTGAKLIWSTTTPVPNATVTPPRHNKNVIAFNKIAQEVMAPYGSAIKTCDLYAWVMAKCDPQGTGSYSSRSIQLPNNVHYNDEGWQYLSQKMIECVRDIM